jgi:hypothetical protein
MQPWLRPTKRELVLKLLPGNLRTWWKKKTAVYQPATQACTHEKKNDDRRNESQQTLCTDKSIM